MSIINHHPQFFIHVGPTKTGTTSIQHFFSLVSDELLKHGLLYPRTSRLTDKSMRVVLLPDSPGGRKRVYGENSSHMLLAWSTLGKVKGVSNDYYWNELYQEIETHQPSKVLISAEQFTFFSHKDIEKLKAFLPTDTTKIIIFRRNLASYIYSVYCQRLKMGSCRTSFSKFVSENGRWLSKRFESLGQKWGAAFGIDNVIQLDFDDLVKDKMLENKVLEEVGLDPQKTPSIDKAKSLQNKSPRLEVLHALQLLNSLHHIIGRHYVSDIVFKVVRGRISTSFVLIRPLLFALSLMGNHSVKAKYTRRMLDDLEQA